MREISPTDLDGMFEPFAEKMRRAELEPVVIHAFYYYYGELVHGATGLIPEDSISAVESLPDAEKLSGYAEAGRAALARTVLLKLNGGLGTGMGLDGPKSLLTVKADANFLDIIANQVLSLRHQHGIRMPLLLMNSFNTQDESLAALAHYPELAGLLPLDFMQHQVPKVLQENFAPATWPADPELEWCPPGHGDIYPALVTSDILDAMLANGFEYAFVSNADNLGAVIDEQILGYLATHQVPFLMEVADRTEADKKGGHLALHNGRLILRELAQCPEQDLPSFQDVSRHRFFNTNNIWLHLPTLKVLLDESEGMLHLPIIRNAKTLNPKDSNSPKVYQLETAMGSAISVFEGAQAVRVPRSRFAPVKLCSDLLVLWSDVYTLTEDWRVVVNPDRTLGPISVDLDPRYYKLISDLQLRVPGQPPSLIGCSRLVVRGDVRFEDGITITGNVTITNNGPEPLVIPAGTTLHGD